MTHANIGVSLPRRDLPEKLTGEAKYTADIRLPGMLHGKILRSPHAHARILAVDASAAARLPGVHAVLTPFDAPDGRVAPDVRILDTKARFVGDEVAAVAAADEDTAEEALRLIEVSYEPLPFVTDSIEAMRAGAPEVHDGGNLVNGKPITLERGNVEEGFAEADRIFEDEFATPSHSGAALEPRAAIAAWEGERLTVWKSSRGIHADRLNLSLSLGIPREDVRVIGPHMGAGYGNKDETRLAAITAILARRAGEAGQDRAYEGRGVHRRPQSPRHDDKTQGGRQTGRHDYGDTRDHHHGHGRVPLLRPRCHTARRTGRALPLSLRQRPLRRLPGLHEPALRRLLSCPGRATRPLRARVAD